MGYERKKALLPDLFSVKVSKILVLADEGSRFGMSISGPLLSSLTLAETRRRRASA